MMKLALCIVFFAVAAVARKNWQDQKAAGSLEAMKIWQDTQDRFEAMKTGELAKDRSWKAVESADGASRKASQEAEEESWKAWMATWQQSTESLENAVEQTTSTHTHSPFPTLSSTISVTAVVSPTKSLSARASVSATPSVSTASKTGCEKLQCNGENIDFLVLGNFQSGNYSTSTSLEGTLYVKGYAGLRNTTVGKELSALQTNLVVGRSLDFSSGTVNGKVYIGESSALARDVVESMPEGSGIYQGNVYDFAEANHCYTKQNWHYCGMSETGHRDVRGNAMNFFSKVDSNRNYVVHSVTCDLLEGYKISRLNFHTKSVSQTVLINVHPAANNKSCTFPGKNTFIDHDGKNLLWNFCYVDDLYLDASGKGSIMAPTTNVIVREPDVEYRGQIVAKSFSLKTSNFAHAREQFNGCLPEFYVDHY